MKRSGLYFIVAVLGSLILGALIAPIFLQGDGAAYNFGRAWLWVSLIVFGLPAIFLGQWVDKKKSKSDSGPDSE